MTAQAEALYADGKIQGWNVRGRSVRVLIHKTWWPLTVALIAEMEG